jgi:hypothetical protein
LSQLVEAQPYECQTDVDAEVDQVLDDAALAAKPIGEVIAAKTFMARPLRWISAISAPSACAARLSSGCMG